MREPEAAIVVGLEERQDLFGVGCAEAMMLQDTHSGFGWCHRRGDGRVRIVPYIHNTSLTCAVMTPYLPRARIRVGNCVYFGLGEIWPEWSHITVVFTITKKPWDLVPSVPVLHPQTPCNDVAIHVDFSASHPRCLHAGVFSPIFNIIIIHLSLSFEFSVHAFSELTSCFSNEKCDEDVFCCFAPSL